MFLRRRKEALALIDELTETAKSTYVSSFDLAVIHTALGEPGKALDWLERAFEERADHLPYAGVNPPLDPLRSEPRFRAILERMGLGDVPDGLGP